MSVAGSKRDPVLPHRDVLHSHVAGIVRDTELAGASRLIEVFESCGDGGIRRSNKSALDARHRSDYRGKLEQRIEISQEVRDICVIVLITTQHATHQRQDASGAGGPLPLRAGHARKNSGCRIRLEELKRRIEAPWRITKLPFGIPVIVVGAKDIIKSLPTRGLFCGALHHTVVRPHPLLIANIAVAARKHHDPRRPLCVEGTHRLPIYRSDFEYSFNLYGVGYARYPINRRVWINVRVSACVYVVRGAHTLASPRLAH